jgi:hypothetical protein
MTPYLVAGYLHLVGGIGLFVALGLEWALIVRLRNAHTVEQARAWLSLTRFQSRQICAATARRTSQRWTAVMLFRIRSPI